MMMLRAACMSGVILLFSADFTYADIFFDGRLSRGDFSIYTALEANGANYVGNQIPRSGIPGHLERVLDPGGSGKFVALATRLTDDALTHGGYRSEMSAPTDPMGSERWYSWDYYLPDTQDYAKNEAVIAQVHDQSDVGESGARHVSLGLWVQDNRLKLVNSFDYDRITSPSGISSVEGIDYESRELASWELETEKWTHLDLHVQWAGDDTGFMEFWKDGILLFQESNHINTFNDERGLWFKNGVYNWSPNSESISTYTSGVRIGDGKETLQSMSTIPEPSVYLMMLAGLAGMGFFSYKRQ